MNNPYEQIEKHLQNNHFYFNQQITVGKGGDVVTGLTAYCPPILHSDRVARLKELLDDKLYSVDWFPNVQEIKISKK